MQTKSHTVLIIRPQVYTGQYNHHDVAIKVFSESSFAFRLEDFYREVAIMSMISHPNVVRFEGACIEQRRDEEGVFMIVTELMHQGSLKSVVERSPLTYDKVFKYALEIAEGMIFLHSFDIIHRDLKSENVLVSSSQLPSHRTFPPPHPTPSTNCDL